LLLSLNFSFYSVDPEDGEGDNDNDGDSEGLDSTFATLLDLIFLLTSLMLLCPLNQSINKSIPIMNVIKVTHTKKENVYMDSIFVVSKEVRKEKNIDNSAIAKFNCNELEEPTSNVFNSSSDTS